MTELSLSLSCHWEVHIAEANINYAQNKHTDLTVGTRKQQWHKQLFELRHEDGTDGIKLQTLVELHNANGNTGGYKSI